MPQRSNIKILHSKLNKEQKAEDDFFCSKKSMCSVKDIEKIISWKQKSLAIFKEIISKYKLDFSGKTLELAGGYGVHSAYLKKEYGDEIELYYSDSSLTAVKKSSELEEFFHAKIDHKLVMEAEDIKMEDGTFDNIFFFAGFHHIQDPKHGISECHRALKKGGKLCLILEPSCPKVLKTIYERHTKREIKERNYSRKEYNEFLSANFSTFKLHTFSGFKNRETNLSRWKPSLTRCWFYG